LPGASPAGMGTGWCPNPSRVPPGGVWFFTNDVVGVQLSDATRFARKSGVLAPQSSPAARVRSAGHCTTGGVPSATVTWTTQLATLPEVSATVMLTGWVP